MADRIVQLIDKDNNNIYPVAGSMAGDSIMTAMLQDGAVTTAKVANNSVTEDKVAQSAVRRLFSAYYCTSIPNNADLNTVEYCQPGIRCCYTDASAETLSNTPTRNAFRMEVYNTTNNAITITADTSWRYIYRRIVDLNGREFTQRVISNGNTPPTWSYGPWRDTGQTITMTTTDPGEGSALEAGALIGVYNA